VIALAFLSVSIAVHADIGPILITPHGQSERPSFQTGDVAAGEYTGARETISAEQLQRAGTSIAEIAAAESGVQFRQSGGLGSFSTVTLRGSSAQQVNVYLDGVLLNEAAGGGVNLSDVELLDASQVDIYRGVVPVQLGNSAIGGAVNITTMRAGDLPTARVLAGTGAFGSSTLSAAWSGPVDGFNTSQLVATFSHRQADNNFSFVSSNGTPLNPLDDRRERRNNSQNSTTSALFKTTHELGQTGKLDNAFQFFSRNQGLVDWDNSPTARATLDTGNLQWRSTLRRDPDQRGWATLWEFNANAKDETFDDSNGDIGLGRQRVKSETQITGLRLYREKVMQGRTLALNARARLEALDSRDLLGATSNTRALRRQLDAAFQYNRAFDDGINHLSLGLFATIVDDNYRIENDTQIRDNFVNRAISPQLGFSRTLSDNWSVRANLSAQTRAPSFYELFGSRGLFEGNSDLDIERATNLDLGLNWQSDVRGKRDFSLEGVLFAGQRRDLITRIYDARGVGRSFNISRATVVGLELDGKADFGNGLSLDSSLTLQDARNRSSIRGANGEQLPGEAQLAGTITTTWRDDNWRLQYEASFANGRYYDTVNLLKAKDQLIHSIRATRSWKRWRVQLELNNLGDENYEDFNGFPKPGRAGFINVFYQP
jgi:iron complex outermembrane receptor protein